MDNPTPPPSTPTLPQNVGGPPLRRPAGVPAGNGVQWWAEGWRIFVASPWIWIAMTVLFVLIVIMLSFVPLIGPIAATVLSPVLVGGMMIGCRAVDRGGTLTIGHLFMGFSDYLVPLIVVGLLYLVISLVIVFVMMAIMVAAIGMSGIAALMSGDPWQSGFEFVATFGLGMLLALTIGLLLYLPLLMAYWFAPALVVFGNEDPWGAMKSSFAACLVNVMPMLLYSILGLVFALLASIPLGLGWLVLLPVFAATIYAGYKDVYGDPGVTVSGLDAP